MKARIRHLLRQADGRGPDAPHRFLEGDELLFACDVGQRGQLVWAAVTERFVRVMDCDSHTVCFDLVPIGDVALLLESTTSPVIGAVRRGRSADLNLSVSSRENREALLGWVLRAHVLQGSPAPPLLSMEGDIARHLRASHADPPPFVPLPCAGHDLLGLSKNPSVKAKLASHGDQCVHFTDRVVQLPCGEGSGGGGGDAAAGSPESFFAALSAQDAHAKPGKVVILSDRALYVTDKVGKVEFRCPVESVTHVAYRAVPSMAATGGVSAVTVVHLTLVPGSLSAPSAYAFAARRGDGFLEELRSVLDDMVEGVPSAVRLDEMPVGPAAPAAAAAPASSPFVPAAAAAVAAASTVAPSPSPGPSLLRSPSRSPSPPHHHHAAAATAASTSPSLVSRCEQNIAQQLLVDLQRSELLAELSPRRLPTPPPPPPPAAAVSAAPQPSVASLSASSGAAAAAEAAAALAVAARSRVGVFLSSPTPSPYHPFEQARHDMEYKASPAELQHLQAPVSARHRVETPVVAPAPAPAAAAGAVVAAPVLAAGGGSVVRSEKPLSQVALFGDDYVDEEECHTQPTTTADDGASVRSLQQRLSEAESRVGAYMEANDLLRAALEGTVSEAGASPMTAGGVAATPMAAAAAAAAGEGVVPQQPPLLSSADRNAAYFASLPQQVSAASSVASASVSASPSPAMRGGVGGGGGGGGGVSPRTLFLHTKAAGGGGGGAGRGAECTKELELLVSVRDSEITDLRARLAEAKAEAKAAAAAAEAQQQRRAGGRVVPPQPHHHHPLRGSAAEQVATLEKAAAAKAALSDAALAYARLAERKLGEVRRERYPERVESLEAKLVAAAAAEEREEEEGGGGGVSGGARAGQKEYEASEAGRRMALLEEELATERARVEYATQQGARIAADVIEKAKERSEQVAGDAAAARLHLRDALRTVEELQGRLAAQGEAHAHEAAEHRRRLVARESEVQRVFDAKVADIEARAQQHERRLSKAQAGLLQEVHAKELELQHCTQELERRAAGGGGGGGSVHRQQQQHNSQLQAELHASQERCEQLAAQLRIANMQLETVGLEVASARPEEGGGGGGEQQALLEKLARLEEMVAARDALLREARTEPALEGVLRAAGEAAEGTPSAAAVVRRAGSMSSASGGVGGGSPSAAAAASPYTALRRLRETQETVASLTELNRLLQNKVARFEGERELYEKKLADIAEDADRTTRHCEVAVLKARQEVDDERKRAVDACAALEAKGKALEVGILLKRRVEDCYASSSPPAPGSAAGGAGSGRASSPGGHLPHHVPVDGPPPPSTAPPAGARRQKGAGRSGASSAQPPPPPQQHYTLEQYEALLEEHLRAKLQVSKLQAAAERLQKQARAAHKEAAEARRAAEAAEDGGHAAAEETERLQRKQAGLRKAADDATAQRDAAAEEAAALREYVEAHRVEALSQKLLKSTAQFEELNGHLERQREEARQAEAERSALLARVQDLEAAEEALSAEADEKDAAVARLTEELTLQSKLHERRHQDNIRGAIEKAMQEMGVLGGGAADGAAASATTPASATPSPPPGGFEHVSSQHPPAAPSTAASTDAAAAHEFEGKIASIQSSLRHNPHVDATQVDRCVARLYNAFHAEEADAAGVAVAASAEAVTPPPSQPPPPPKGGGRRERAVAAATSGVGSPGGYSRRYSLVKQTGVPSPAREVKAPSSTSATTAPSARVARRGAAAAAQVHGGPASKLRQRKGSGLGASAQAAAAAPAAASASGSSSSKQEVQGFLEALYQRGGGGGESVASEAERPAADGGSTAASSPSPRIRSQETAALYAKLGLSDLAPYSAT